MADSIAPAPDDHGAPHTPGSRVLGWLVALLAVVIIGVLFMHVFAPAIASEDVPPPGHPQSLCIGCHIVTGS